MKDRGVIVFLSNFGGGNVADAVTQAQDLKIAGVNSTGSTYGLSSSAAADLLNKIVEVPANTEGSTDFSSRNGITICLSDGGNKRASVTIGAAGSESTNLKIGNVPSECL